MKISSSFANNRAVRAIVSFTLFVSVLVPMPSRSTAAQNGVGRERRIEGQVEIVYEDSRNHGRLRYFVKTNEGKVELKFAQTPSETLRSGMRISATGVQVGKTLELHSSQSIAVSESSLAVSANTTGQHRVLVIMVNFADKQTYPFTREQAQTVMSSTNDYYREASYGQTSLSTDVFGWYTIPVSSTTCDTAAIATYAQQAVAAGGANISGYEHIVYAFPQNACTWQGRGSVGGSPSQAWVNEWFDLATVGHELGHNFGLYHSRSMDCGDLSLGPNCTTNEYGDMFDLMGGANSAHFNVFQKERLGWINGGANPPITTVNASGTYWIDGYAQGTLNPKGLKVLKSTDPTTGFKTWYYIERRTSFGFDSFVTGNQNISSGVLVRIGSESSGQETYLLDMTPTTVSWYDPALTVGQTFNDPAARITITTVSADSAGATVSLTLAPETCVRANPTVTITPSQSAWIRSGATATFNAAVRNNDSNGCAASIFNVQVTVPSGWTSTSTPIGVSPGATVATPVQVTSPMGAADGYYGATIMAANAGNSVYSSSALATYSLVSVLSVNNSSSQKSYTRSQTATVNASVKAAGMASTGATVTFTMTKSNGTTISSVATTDSNGGAVFKYALNRKKDPAGTYQVRAEASANGIAGVGNVSFVVK